MLQGKIIQDAKNYMVKMGGVTIDITADIHILIARENERLMDVFKQEIRQEKVRLATILERYNQIARIILTDPMSGPVGAQGEGPPCQGSPTD